MYPFLQHQAPKVSPKVSCSNETTKAAAHDCATRQRRNFNTAARQTRPNTWVQKSVPSARCATPTPIATAEHFSMFARCGGLFIHCCITTVGFGQPQAMFSPIAAEYPAAAARLLNVAPFGLT